MTELIITPKVQDKTARFKGAIAAGEHVAVTIKGGAEWIGEDDGANLVLRVIDLTTKHTLAVFPRPPETLAEGETFAEGENEWDSDESDLTCKLNLNTARMVNAARHMITVPVLFVLGDTDNPRTLYFRDQYEVEYWPERIGDDVPYDLDAWPKQIDDWTALVAEWQSQMAAFNTTLTGHVGNNNIHVTAEQKAAWTAKQSAINDLEAIRAGAAKGATALQEHQDISNKADLENGKVPQSQLPDIGGKFIVVEELPSAATADPKTIYLVPRTTGETNNVYDEYLRVEPTTGTYAWEKIGSTNIDLSGYLPKSDVIDPRIATQTGKAADAKATGDALAARPTKAQLDAGWWSGWTILRNGVNITAQVEQPEWLPQINLWDFQGTILEDDGFYFVLKSITGSEDDTDLTLLPSIPPPEPISYTATRHRVAAPVPTKPEDIGAQPAGSYATAAQGEKADAALSRAEAEAGFTEWKVSPATCNNEPIVVAKIVDGDQKLGYWSVFFASDAVHSVDNSLAMPYNDDSNATSLTWSAGDSIDGGVTATRTRLPTMADLDGKASTNDVALTPVYSQTPTYSEEWTFAGQSPISGYHWVVEFSSPYWFLWAVDDTSQHEGPPTSSVEASDNAVSLVFEVEGGTVVATRTRTDIIGYTLGDQTTKPLQPKGDYAQASLLAEKASLDSPAFTGSPTAPTAASGDNSTKLATTAFVQDAIGSSSSNPLSGQSFDFATMQGVFVGVKACIEALGGSVTNFPANN